MSYKRRNTSAMLTFPKALWGNRPWIAYAADKDDPSAGSGQADPPADDDPPKDDAKLDNPPKTAEELQAELDRTRAALEKANSEAKDKRLKLNELTEAEEKRRKEQEAAEAERLKEQQKYQELYEKEQQKAAAMEARISEMEQRQRQAAIADALRAQAADLGFATPTDAALFIDSNEYALDDDGKLTNAEQLVKALAEERPYLLAQPDPVPGNGRGPTPAGKGTKANEQQRDRWHNQAARRYR